MTGPATRSRPLTTMSKKRAHTRSLFHQTRSPQQKGEYRDQSHFEDPTDLDIREVRRLSETEQDPFGNHKDKAKEDKKIPVHKDIQKLLDRYKDVFPDDSASRAGTGKTNRSRDRHTPGIAATPPPDLPGCKLGERSFSRKLSTSY